MEQLAAHARSLESGGDLQAAREKWLACLPFLPAHSVQAEWIRNHVRELDAGSSPQTGHTASGSMPEWAKKLGPLGPILLALLKFKSLLSFVAFFGFYWTIWGAKFGIGFAILILIHEMGHFIDIKRRGLPADMPMFLPGFGAYVKWNALGVCYQLGRAVCWRARRGSLLFVMAPNWLWIMGSTGPDRRVVQRAEFDSAVDIRWQQRRQRSEQTRTRGRPARERCSGLCAGRMGLWFGGGRNGHPAVYP
jgi:hypothetical protein